MKRWPLRVGVFLLLGAIANVAVAWAGQFPDLNRGGPWHALNHDDAAEVWSDTAPTWPIPAAPFAIEYRNPVWTILQIDSSIDARAPYGLCKAECGWPFWAMQGFSYHEPTGNRRRNLSFFSYGIILPYEPIWPGFAINTIFYAAILWLLFAFPFTLRRRRRVKRGLCPACAYPVGDSAVCTECGQAHSLSLISNH